MHLWVARESINPSGKCEWFPECGTPELTDFCCRWRDALHTNIFGSSMESNDGIPDVPGMGLAETRDTFTLPSLLRPKVLLPFALQ